MNKNTKLTLEDLIAKKEQVLESKKATAQLYIGSLDGCITVQKPTSDLVADSVDMGKDIDANKYLIYNCVTEPNLKNKQLQDAYGCIEPTDIIEKIFELGEINSIAEQIMKLAGFKNNNVNLVEKIKN